MKVITTNLLNRFWKNGVLKKLELKVDTAKIINNFTTTVAGNVADARALKTLRDLITGLQNKTDELNGKMTTDALDISGTGTFVLQVKGDSCTAVINKYRNSVEGFGYADVGIYKPAIAISVPVVHADSGEIVTLRIETNGKCALYSNDFTKYLSGEINGIFQYYMDA